MATTVEVARANGICIPVLAWAACQRVGIPYAVGCAFLEQESAGGANVFGHDGGADGYYSGAGIVTPTKYRAYKAGRDAHGAQGVGPMQLTWPPYQDRADAAGGCWVPTHNVNVGLAILRGFIDSGKTWHQAAAAYNGSETYADQVDAKITRWQALLADATPPTGDPVDIYTPTPYYTYRYSGGPMQTCVRDLQALELLRRDLNAAGLDYPNPLYLYQGCYHDGSKSAGTHTGSSVYDLHPSDAQKKAELGARHGIIVFHRPYNWDGAGGGEHLHCIVRGGAKMAAAARAQVADWDQHLDGLAGHRPYDGPWYPVKPFVYHKPKPPEQPKDPPLGVAAMHQLHDDIVLSRADTLRLRNAHPVWGPRTLAPVSQHLAAAAGLLNDFLDGDPDT